MTRTPQEHLTARAREAAKLIRLDHTARMLAAAEHARLLSADGVTEAPDDDPQPVEWSGEFIAAVAYERIVETATAEGRLGQLLATVLDMIADAHGIDKYGEIAENVRALALASDDEVLDMTLDRIVGGGK